MSEINEEILDIPPDALAGKILGIVEHEPETFCMSSWLAIGGYHSSIFRAEQNPHECNTTLCVAGWAAHLVGYTLDAKIGCVIKPDGYWSIESVARDLLGLTSEEAHELFCEMNEEQAKFVLRRLAAGEPCPSLYDVDDMTEEELNGP